ncbi:MAG TPA: exo-alpha-sialidase [Gemmataceae bacterium]|nr:exo-alpha-sialidase [Gemmataceae bacterium]
MSSILSAIVFCSMVSLAAAETEATRFYQAELIFPPEHWHNHASCIVECPNGDLLVCWYNGSGERSADDVKVEGARQRATEKVWSRRFLMADTPGFPDTNPCMFIDPQKRLWLLWQTLIANQWHTALAKYKISSAYQSDGPPEWQFSDTILLKPGPEFARIVGQQCDKDEANVDSLPTEVRSRTRAYLAQRRKSARDKYSSRMGWMTRAHPFVLEGKRLIVPLYSDGFNFSIMALSDDWGRTWEASEPLVGAGNVQPSLARKKDGTLVAYMRDNGPPPKRLMVSESRDSGKTWSPVRDTDIPNPGSGAEVLGLRDGRWVLVYNDTERGRHSLAVSLSEDEGKTWKWTRRLEYSEPGPDATHASYPSIIQAKDGTLHVSYTYTLNGKNVKRDAQGRPQRECIKHAHFDEAWIKSGMFSGGS